eukprot:10179403-Ditylum_brightwellii.AAC.1
MAPCRQNNQKQSKVTTLRRSASSAVRPLQLPNWTRLISLVFSAIGTSLLFQITFIMAFISPSTIIMILSCVILGLPGSFSNMISIAFCHLLGINLSRNGNAIIVLCSRLIPSE